MPALITDAAGNALDEQQQARALAQHEVAERGGSGVPTLVWIVLPGSITFF